jgi:hypothetical protein
MSFYASLDEDIVEFSPTFIGMSDSKLIHIVNNSEELSFFEIVPCGEGTRTDSSLNFIEIFPMVRRKERNS